VYRKTSDRSRAPDRRRAPHTGRGSDSFVLIEAGGFYPKFYGIFNLRYIDPRYSDIGTSTRAGGSWQSATPRYVIVGLTPTTRRGSNRLSSRGRQQSGVHDRGPVVIAASPPPTASSSSVCASCTLPSYRLLGGLASLTALLVWGRCSSARLITWHSYYSESNTAS